MMEEKKGCLCAVGEFKEIVIFNTECPIKEHREHAEKLKKAKKP